MIEKYVVIKDQLVPWPKVAAARRERAAATRSTLPTPMVIRDGLDGVKNPVDGKTYDSKSAYYRAVKDAGCVIVGNEAEKLSQSPPKVKEVTSDDIDRAMNKVLQGYKPMQEYDKDFDAWLP